MLITLARIKTQPIHGNHFADQHTFQMIERYLDQPCTSWDNKREALRYMSEEMMSCPFSERDNTISSQQLVEEYIANRYV